MTKPLSKAFLLRHERAPGDITVLTGLVRDIKTAYPDIRIGIDRATHCQDLFQCNPYLTPASQMRDAKVIVCDYGKGIKGQKKETVHFLPYFHRDFTHKTGLSVPCTLPYPDLHLSDYERQTKIVSGRYWVVLSGGKHDVPIKVWSTEHFQTVVNTLKDAFGITCVQVGNTTGAWHPSLDNVVDLRGKTNLRGLMQVIHHADGVICGVTCAMHMAAALQKPCVVLAGGREAWWWEAYVRENSGLPNADLLRVPHRFLHTIGQLDCCRYHGCWLQKVRPAAAGEHTDRNSHKVCHHPDKVGTQYIAGCMAMIRPEHVVNAVASYYTDNTLPAIGEMPPMPELVSSLREQIKVSPVQQEPVAVVNSKPVLRVVNNTRFTPAVSDPDYDNAVIGGKLTFHILLYGNYHGMHRACLSSLMQSVPADRREIRIGSAALCQESLDYVAELVASGDVSWHYKRPDNPGKYVIMRELFHSTTDPIQTNWTVWFDDDTLCNVDPLWCKQMCRVIAANASKGIGMVGPHATFRVSPGLSAWIKSGSWYKGRMFRDSRGKATPNGNIVHFTTGSLWAIQTSMIKLADIPDTRLVHNGGDVTIGEQLWQAGFSIAGFSGQKQNVNWSSTKRRGRDENYPWGGKAPKKA